MSVQPYKDYFMERPNALHSFLSHGIFYYVLVDTLGEPEK